MRPDFALSCASPPVPGPGPCPRVNPRRRGSSSKPSSTTNAASGPHSHGKRPRATSSSCSGWTPCSRPTANPIPCSTATAWFRRRTSPTRSSGPARSSARTSCWSRSARAGFGVVFLAEQTEPVRRKVALKVLKPGMDTAPGGCPLRGGAAGPGDDGPPATSPASSTGCTAATAGVRGRPYFVMELVKGVPITEFCDAEPPDAAAAAGTVHPGLPGGAARASEGRHPPRPQAVERPGIAARLHAGRQGHRLRRRQGARPDADGQDALHRHRPDDRDAPVHVPRTGRDERPGRGHALGHLFARRAALRAADGHDAASPGIGSRRRPTTRFAASSARRNRPSRAPG